MRLRSFMMTLSALGACGAMLLAADMYRRLLQAETAAIQAPLNAAAGAALVFGMAHVIAAAALAILFLALSWALYCETPAGQAAVLASAALEDVVELSAEIQPVEATLILFTKIPRPGRCKTRLIEKLGPDGAADLASAMLKDLVDALAGELKPEIRCVLCFDPGDGESPESAALLLREMLAEVPGALHRFDFIEQRGGALGERLAHAYMQAQAQRPGPCALIGSDALLPAAKIEAALLLAAHGRAGLLPALDGGYVLLALPKNAPATVFENVTWSCGETAAMQQAQLARCGIDCEVLAPPCFDVDEERDLAVLQKYLAEFQESAPRTRRWMGRDASVEHALGESSSAS